MKKLKRKYSIPIFILLLWFVAHSIFITFDGLSENESKADIAVILGNKINEDGSISERLKSRLDCGINLYKTNRINKILVSGGLGKEGYYEGNKMREYLINKNIPDSIIIVDNYGDNTIATVKNSLKLKDSLKFESILVVSQYFHITRLKMLYKKHGFSNIQGASPRYFELHDLYSIFREFFGFYLEYIGLKN